MGGFLQEPHEDSGMRKLAIKYMLGELTSVLLAHCWLNQQAINSTGDIFVNYYYKFHWITMTS
jgi:hypothetical protein